MLLHRPPHPVEQGDPAVSRALRSHNVWLAITYVSLLLLMAHAQV